VFEMSQKNKTILTIIVVIFDIILLISVLCIRDATMNNNIRKEVRSLVALDFTKDRYNTKLRTSGSYGKVEDTIKDSLKDDEIKKYYNEKVYGQVKASHILIGIDAKEDATDEEKEKADKKALEKAKSIIKELEDGKKFETLAKKNSADEATSTKGGDLGYFDLDTMTEAFSNALKELKKDEYTKEPVKTEYGYHIILKTGEKEKPKLKDVKDDVKEKLTKQKLNDDNSLFYEALVKYRENNKISWNDDVLKKAYENYMNELIENAKK